ncbi:terminase large subunit [Pseudoduganella plicata]|uniref:Terminase n=1 Tax=Pseudoduganella plicata TaxID=321984 RepID=A0A4V1ATM6_9BURK|nr:terminase large subunit [Pseudoduganella plicata]QBQ36198.1 terminase large subunit [Pseudoduganella plicata]GGY77265.1 terminase [Pseudoduganella plicata]
MEWSTACPDWADRLLKGETIIPPPIFPEQGEHALAIFKALKIVDAPGSPTFGESCAEWVFDLVRCIFGAYDAENGRRLIVEFFVLIPKKNSKSTIAAGIMMTALILNWRQSAEFSVLAPTVEVANNAYAPARDMVQKDEDLDDLMHVQSHVKTITHRESNATLKVLAADQNTVGGKKSVGTLVDELHLFGKISSAENMFREALGGRASRPEGFVIWLSTQSDEPPAGVFRQKLEYARKVRDGEIVDPAFVPIIFEHPPEMVASGDALKLENMRLVNPNIGFSVDEAFLEREYKIAEQAGPESFRGFMAKHANVEIGMNLRSDRWAGADFWARQAVPVFDLHELIERSEIVDVGIDGGGLDDLLGFAAVGHCAKTRQWLTWAHAWAHPSVLERRKDIAPRLQDFAKAGDLTLVTRIGDDVDGVAQFVAAIEDAGKLDKVGCDSMGLGGIADALLEAGIPEEKVVGISQGWKMTGAIKTAERKLAEGVMVHPGQALMAWCVGNARIEPRGNGVIITKQASGTAKIDPLLAVLNAVTLMALNPETQVVPEIFVLDL